METKIPILLAFLLVIPLSTEAKFSKYVGVGLNRASFRTEECKALWGPSLEIGLDYYPVKSFGGFIGSGLMYQNKKLFMENRTWASAWPSEYSEWVWSGDFDVSISYLEIPLQIGYSIKINDGFSASIFSGYSLAIPLKDHTRTKNRKVTPLMPNEIGAFDFDYFLTDESGVPCSINHHIGCQLSYYQYILIISYAKGLSSTKSLEGKSVDDKIDAFKISIAYRF